MNFLTVGDIAKELKVDRDAVTYAIRKANIEPVGHAGIVRLFSANAVEAVRQFLQTKQQRNRERLSCTAHGMKRNL
jgi:hypothetical protein